MRKGLGLIVFMLLGSFYFQSCKHDSPVPAKNNGNTNNPTDTNKIVKDTSLCFERDILPIFTTNCAKSGCHDAVSKQDDYIFTSYATITSKKFKPGDLDDTELWEKITETDHDKRMPPPPNQPLTTKEINLIKDWILRGGPNTTDCPTICDSMTFKFAADIQPIINTQCKGCHNNALPSAGYSFETYAGVLKPIQAGRFLGAIKHQAKYIPMPRGGNKLTDCQIKKIEKWIANGVPND